MSNMNTKLAELKSIIKAGVTEVALAKHVRADLRAAVSHFEAGLHRDLAAHSQDSVSIEIHLNWLRSYLGDQKANRKKEYAPSYINNMCNSIRRACEAADESLSMDQGSTSIQKAWQLIAEATPYRSRHFEAVWPRFLGWLTVEPVSPDDFTDYHWQKFRVHLSGDAKLGNGSFQSYSSVFKRWLSALGYTLGRQQKKAARFSNSIEEQIKAIGFFAISERDYYDVDPKFRDLVPGKIKGDSWVGYREQLIALAKFHLDKVESTADLSSIVNAADLNAKIKWMSSQRRYSAATVECMVGAFLSLSRYCFAMKLASFKTMSNEQMVEHQQAISELYGKKDLFKHSVVSERREANPLPDYTSIYFRIEKAVNSTWKKCDRKLAVVRKINDPHERDKNIRSLATTMREAVLAVFLLHFPLRPKDMFGFLVVRPVSNPENGETIPNGVYRNEFGDWVVRLKCSKTNRVDRVKFGKRKSPWVHFAFPPWWTDLLEVYLNDYLPYLNPDSPLLFPISKTKSSDKTDSQQLIGSRSRAGRVSHVAEISERFCGELLRTNAFRTMFQTFLTSCDLEHDEGRFVGHVEVGKMSAVSRKHYQCMPEYLINKKGKRFYDAFKEELEASRRLQSISHRKK
jgi:hypothetical protein